MRVLVISDTHGYLETTRQVIRERGPWDHIIHLGDSVLDAVELAADLGVDITTVRGNNEYPGAPDTNDVLVFDVGPARFYAIHGHELDINPYAGDDRMEENLKEIAKKAKQAGAKTALFGHTHQPLIKELDGVLLVNPGGMGLGDKRKTCAAIEVEESGSINAELMEME